MARDISHAIPIIFGILSYLPGCYEIMLHIALHLVKYSDTLSLARFSILYSISSLNHVEAKIFLARSMQL